MTFSPGEERLRLGGHSRFLLSQCGVTHRESRTPRSLRGVTGVVHLYAGALVIQITIQENRGRTRELRITNHPDHNRY